MRPCTSLIVAVLALAPLAGCEKKSEPPTSPTPVAPAADAVKVAPRPGPNVDVDKITDVIETNKDGAAKELELALIYTRDGYLDSAETIVATVEKHEDSLALSVQTRLAKVRQELDAAKQARARNAASLRQVGQALRLYSSSMPQPSTQPATSESR